MVEVRRQIDRMKDQRTSHGAEDKRTTDSYLRLIHTMKVMHIGSELICIVCVHTECALTAIRIECAFSQSTSIGALKPV